MRQRVPLREPTVRLCSTEAVNLGNRFFSLLTAPKPLKSPFLRAWRARQQRCALLPPTTGSPLLCARRAHRTRLFRAPTGQNSGCDGGGSLPPAAGASSIRRLFSGMAPGSQRACMGGGLGLLDGLRLHCARPSNFFARAAHCFFSSSCRVTRHDAKYQSASSRACWRGPNDRPDGSPERASRTSRSPPAATRHLLPLATTWLTSRPGVRESGPSQGD